MADQLTCGACGFSNEPERVYCHNCGAKLDRSLLPMPAEDQSQAASDKARKRIKKMTNPAGYTVGQFFKSLITTTFWAALVASGYLISQKPEGVPEAKNDLPTRLVQSELMDAVQSPVPRAIGFSQDDINAALKQSLRRATPPGEAGGWMEFKRAFSVLTPGVIHIGTEQELFGYPIFSAVDYELKVVGGKFTPVLLGGSFGRLPVRVEVMQYLDFAFQKLWTALKREHDQMANMQSVSITQGQIVFVTKGGQPAR